MRIANEILMYFRGQRKSSSDVSLSECFETGKDGNSLSLLDVLPTDEDLFEDFSTRESCARLGGLMERCLSGREREILAMRYGLGGKRPLAQREVAVKLGISRSYVSRIEKKALQKLRQELE